MSDVDLERLVAPTARVSAGVERGDLRGLETLFAAREAAVEALDREPPPATAPTGVRAAALRLADLHAELSSLIGAEQARLREALCGVEHARQTSPPTGSPPPRVPTMWTAWDNPFSPGEDGRAAEAGREASHPPEPAGWTSRLVAGLRQHLEHASAACRAYQPIGRARREVTLALRSDYPGRRAVAMLAVVGCVVPFGWIAAGLLYLALAPGRRRR